MKTKINLHSVFREKRISPELKNESKFVGVWVPEEVASLLTLQALSSTQSKSEIIRKGISSWIMSNGSPILTFLSYATEMRKAERVPLKDFKNKLAPFLKSKGVSKKHIEEIIKGVR